MLLLVVYEVFDFALVRTILQMYVAFANAFGTVMGKHVGQDLKMNRIRSVSTYL